MKTTQVKQSRKLGYKFFNYSGAGITFALSHPQEENERLAN